MTMISRRVAMLGGFASTVTACYESSSDANSRKPSQFINVENCGARSLPGFDNTKAIYEAIRQANDGIGGGVIFFPRGRYEFTNIDAEVDELELRGDDAVLVSISPITTRSASIWIRGRRISVSDIKLDHFPPIDVLNRSNVIGRQPNAYGLRLGGSRDPSLKIANSVTVERVSVFNARGGGVQISYASNVNVCDSTIEQVLGNGLGFDGCVQNVIATRNRIRKAGDDLLVVVSDKSVPGGTKNVIFEKNDVKFGFAKGIAATGVDGMLIENNVVSDTFGGGIVCIKDSYYNLGSAHNVLIRKNKVVRAGCFYGKGLFKDSPSVVGDSIYIGSGTSDIRIVDNSISGSVRDGVVVTQCERLEISNNDVGDHPGTGILLGDPKITAGKKIVSYAVTGNRINGNRNGIAIFYGRGGKVAFNTVKLRLGAGGQAYIGTQN